MSKKEQKEYVLIIDVPFFCEKGTVFVKLENLVDFPKNKNYYAPKGKFFPIYDEDDIICSPYFSEKNKAFFF
ncbi:MAG: hypothetical protein WC466_06285 [Candidatus Izemoplasmatales bacterium]